MKVTYLAALMMASAPMSYAAEDVVDLGDMEIVEEGQAHNSAKSAPLYESYDPIDSGLGVISEESINNSRTGGTDTTELLRRMPGVQLDKSSQQAASKRDIQSIRPKDFTISGGPIYGNNVQIDGISMNSLHDVYQPNADNDANGIYGQTSQTLYVNPDLLGSVEVYDSNISARYGEFSGGVVNYEVREPKREFSFKFSTEFQNDSMVRYHKPDFDDPEDAEELDDPASFSKSNSSVTFDIPLTDKLYTLFGYSYSQSTVEYEKDAIYGGKSYDNGDTNQNFLLKAEYLYRDNLTFEGQILYSPYESERDLPARRNDHMESDSSGLQMYVKASGYKGATDWMSKLAYTNNDSSRDWAVPLVRMRGKYLDWCGTTRNCYTGGLGDLDQTQDEYSWDTEFSTHLTSGLLNYGSKVTYTQVSKARGQEANYYYLDKGAETDSFNCEAGDPSCVPTSATRRKVTHPAYDVDIDFYKYALWAEYLRQIGSVEIRAGLRYSYNNYFENHNIAPRLSADWEFLDDTYLTLGANRYYSKSGLTYAIREQIPYSSCTERELKNGSDDSYGGRPGPWSDTCKSGRSQDYYSDDINTPYSDEVSAAITVPTFLDGQFRVKTVYRQNRDQLASSDLQKDTKPNYYTLTNDGKTDYYGYSVEWQGAYDNHAFSANVTWSKTKTFGYSTYLESQDNVDDVVYYHGKTISRSELFSMSSRDNFAAPIKATVAWNARWLNGDLHTGAQLYYLGKYESLSDTGDNYEDAGGSRYDIYDEVEDKALTTIYLNASYRVFNKDNHQALVTLRIDNLLDETTGINADYQMGRAYWLGFSYEM